MEKRKKLTVASSQLKDQHRCELYRKRGELALKNAGNAIHLKNASVQLEAVNVSLMSRALMADMATVEAVLALGREAPLSRRQQYIRSLLDRLMTGVFSQADIIFGLDDSALIDACRHYAVPANAAGWCFERTAQLPFVSRETARQKAFFNSERVKRYLREDHRIPFMVPRQKVEIEGDTGTLEVMCSSFVIFPSRSPDGRFEAVKFRSGKPEYSNRPRSRNRDAHESLELFAMATAAEKAIRKFRLVPDGTSEIALEASFYYLRSPRDTSKELVDEFFPYMEGNRLMDPGMKISLPFLFLNGKPAKETNEFYRPRIDSFLKGERCSGEVCERCEYYRLCQYSRAPIESADPMKKRSLSEIELSEAQSRVTDFRKGIARVNAGAGTGKTLVVSLRTVFMLHEGIAPESILLVTFTNSGAAEMKSRILDYAEDFGLDREDLEERLKVTTFNGFGNEIVADRYEELGYAKPPRLIDGIERKSIITKLLDRYPVEGLDYMNFSMRMGVMGALPCVEKAFELIKRNGILDDVSLNAALKSEGWGNFFGNGINPNIYLDLICLYGKYEEILREKCLIEYADQENLIFAVLDSVDPYYFDKLGFAHIVVDEYQDSSTLQNEIVKRLIETSCFESLLAVGDDSQSIFSFRDANPDNIIRFFETFGEGEDIYMVENHRSTPEIIEFANKVNRWNRNRVDKDLVATRKSGAPVEAYVFERAKENYEWIADDIVKKHDADGVPYGDFVIQAATKAELLNMASVLADRGIETCIAFPEPMLENSRILSILALCDAWENPSASLRLAEVQNALMDGQLFELSNEEIREAADRLADEIRLAKTGSMREQAKWFSEMARQIAGEDSVAKEFAERLDRFRTVREKLEYAGDFRTFDGEDMKRAGFTDGVILSTSHSAKGLEWPVCYVITTKFDPRPGASNDTEERNRLLFVAATRARDVLILTGMHHTGTKNHRIVNRIFQRVFNALGLEFPEEIASEDQRSA